MKKILTILAFTLLLTGLISSKAFAVSIDKAPDEKRSQSEVFYSKDNYNLIIDTQSTTSDTFISWGSSIQKIDTGVVEVQGLTKSYVSSDIIGYTLYVEQYRNGSWTTIKTFSYSLNNTTTVSGNYTLSVASNNYYRVRSTNYITNNGVTTSKSSVSNSIYVN